MVAKDRAIAAVARWIFTFANDDAVGTNSTGGGALLLLLLGVVGYVDGILHFSSFGQVLNLFCTGLALLLAAGGRFLLIGNDVPSAAGHVGNVGDGSGWASGGRSTESIIAGVHSTLGTLVAALLQLTTSCLFVGIGNSIGPASAADGGGRSRIDLMSGQSGGQYEESRCESHCACLYLDNRNVHVYICLYLWDQFVEYFLCNWNERIGTMTKKLIAISNDLIERRAKYHVVTTTLGRENKTSLMKMQRARELCLLLA